MGLCGLGRTYDRTKVVDYTYYTYSDSLSFMTLRPKYKPRNWIASKPFSQTIWACIVCSFYLIGICIFAMYFILASVQRNGHIRWCYLITILQLMNRIVCRQRKYIIKILNNNTKVF